MPDDIQNRGSGDFTGSIPAAYGNYDPMTPLASPNVMSTSQTKDTDLQSLYMEAARRGMFKQDTDMQAIGHELRRRGMVVDPTQGGLVQTEQPTDVTGKALFMKPNDVEKYLGVRYRFGGEGKQGIDCSAFMQQLYARNGVSGLPRVAQDQWSSNRGTKIGDLSGIQPGDQLFFHSDRVKPGEAGHTAYFAGWDTDKSGVKVPMMYAASSAAKSVVKQRLDDFLAKSGQTFLGAKRYPEFQKAGTVQQSVGSPTAAPTPEHLPLVDPRQVQAYSDKFFQTVNPNANIPMKIATRLATVDDTQRAADPQLRRLSPVGQAAVLQQAHFLAQWNKDQAGVEQRNIIQGAPVNTSGFGVSPFLTMNRANPIPKETIEAAQKQPGIAGAVKRLGIGLLDPQNVTLMESLGPIGEAFGAIAGPLAGRAVEAVAPTLARGGKVGATVAKAIGTGTGEQIATRALHAGIGTAFGAPLVKSGIQRIQQGDQSGGIAEMIMGGAFPLVGEAARAVAGDPKATIPPEQGLPIFQQAFNAVKRAAPQLSDTDITSHLAAIPAEAPKPAPVQEPTPTPPVATETRPAPETAPQTVVPVETPQKVTLTVAQPDKFYALRKDAETNFTPQFVEVKGKPVKLEAAPDLEAFVYKDNLGNWHVVEPRTGYSFNPQSKTTRAAALADANTRIAKSIERLGRQGFEDKYINWVIDKGEVSPRYQQGEPTNATQTGQVTEGSQPEHLGVPQGANVPENRAEVRQGEGEQAGGGRGVVGGAEVQQAPQEVAKPAENVMSTSQTAEGEVASPEDQIANEELWGTVKKGDLLTEPGSSQRLRVQAKSTTRIKVVDENKPDAQPFTISRKEFREDYNLNVRPENEPPTAETTPPPEPAPEPEMLTAPRNAVTEAERERRGVSPEVEKQATRQIGEMYERGRQEVENGMDVRTLAESVANKPRNLSGEETAALAYDRARLRSTQEDLEDRIVKADAAGDQPTADALRAQLSSVEGHLVNNEKALQRAGREWAMTGLARQLEIKQDYSASRMITKATVAKGSPLTEGERTQIQAMAKQIQEHASRIEALEKQNELLTQQQISKEAQAAQRQQNRALQQNLLMRQRQMLQRSISTKLSKLGAAPDPTVVPDLIKLARNYAATGINSLDGIVDAVWNDVQDHALRLGWTKPELKEALGNGIRNPASVKPMVDPELAVEKARLRNAQQNADQMLKRMTETTKQRNVRFATELLNVPRSIMETGNLHATMRQGLWLSATDPRLGARSLSASLQALMSGDRAERLNAMAVHSENEGLYRASGLHLAEKGLDKREEAFMSQMAERIPVLGKAVAASGRAYSVGLNVLRTGTFDRGVDLLKEAGKTPQSDPQAYQDLARFVDITSGRGRLGAFEQAAPQLTTILYSPRFMASRLQLIKDAATGFKGYDPVVRKMAIKSLAANSAFALSVMAMARASGATVGTDPNSPDFGKILVGNTHIDVSAGLGPYLRAVARIAAMSYKRYGQGIPPKFGQMNAQDVATNFALSKASPPVSVPIELMRGKDIAGNAVSTPQQVQQNLQREGMQAVIESMAAERLSPIVAREIYEAMKEYGPVKGGAMAIPAFFGVTEQTYAPRVPHAKATSGRTTKPGNFGIRGGTFRSPF